MLTKDSDRHAARIVGVYAVASAAWITLSGHALIALVGDRSRLAAVESAMGLAFVAVTSLLLFVVLRRHFGRLSMAIASIRELNRALRMSAACEAAMIRTRTRQELFDALCRIAVEDGGYLMSWVGLAQDDAEKSVRPVARYGRDEGYLDDARVVWADEAHGRGPTGTAIRTGAASAFPFMVKDAPFAPWRERALARGYHSSVALPLREDGRIIGALTLYSARTESFDPAEMALLEKMGQAIDYALDHLARVGNERAAVERLRKLSQAVENSPVSIVITDASGTIEYVNRKFTEVSGYTAAEAVGQNPRLLKSEEKPSEDYAGMWKTISSGAEWHGEFRNRAKDGTEFWERASISPIRDEHGVITHYVAVKTDITATRALEAQLRQAQKMETIGTLAGGIAHDFNNILTVIQGHCSLLGATPDRPEGDRESIAEIQSSVDRASTLTRQLLAFGRRQPMHARRVDLNESAGKMTRMLRRVVPERISVEAVLSDEPAFARADPAMVDQVLMNLVLNSRDAIAAKGRILIETRACGVVSPPPHAKDLGAGWVALRVTDDGGGIRADHLPRIFEPFFTTKDASRGSGLGLSVVDGIVRQHRGWTEVSSTVGRGATFTVYLPRDAGSADAVAASSALPVPRGTETILLAEDEAPLRRLCARALTALGYRVIEAATGESAVDAWNRRDGPVGLLITDMVMPGALGGDELARRLRADEPDLRVLFVSGYHSSPDHGALTAGKRSAFLQKPFKPEDLARTARALLDAR